MYPKKMAHPVSQSMRVTPRDNSRKFWNQLAVRLGCEICIIIIIFDKTKSQKLKVNALNFNPSCTKGGWDEMTSDGILTLKALEEVFSTPCEVCWLITFDVERFSTRNFVTFPNIKCIIRKK